MIEKGTKSFHENGKYPALSSFSLKQNDLDLKMFHTSVVRVVLEFYLACCDWFEIFDVKFSPETVLNAVVFFGLKQEAGNMIGFDLSKD